MRFARADYDRRIIDVAGKIPQDEPVWLLRAQDAAAPDTLDTWAYQHELRGGDRRMSFEARIVAQEMREWQASHGKKTTDVPADPDEDLPDREVPVRRNQRGEEIGPEDEVPMTYGEVHSADVHQDAPPSAEEMEAQFDRLVEEGLMAHAGEDESGNKLYRITAAGQAVVDALPHGEPETPATSTPTTEGT